MKTANATAHSRHSNTLEDRPHISYLDQLAKHLLFSRLRLIKHGRLILNDGLEQHVFGSSKEINDLRVTIMVNSGKFYSKVVFGGTIGAGEAYMSADFYCSDLTAAVQLLLRNRDVLDGMDDSLLRLTAPLHKVFHWLHDNTRRGSRHNIASHYDLGNRFFGLFLDSTMMYSCAYFKTPEMTLEDASKAKLDHICKKLSLAPGDRVLEIGTGWGGFAIHAAKYYGCHVTTTTISKEQYDLAKKRIQLERLSDRITLLNTDYRDLKGQYDKLVSIEMIEAVGHKHLDVFFKKCSELLEPEGMMLLQAITIADQRYRDATKTVDFIQRYIFPGSFIPSITAISASVTKATDMRLFHMQDIGPHYATTLRLWRERFMGQLPKVRAMDYPEEFIRMWEFYLCYCEGGFLERAIGDAQMVFIKPNCHIDPIVQ